MAASRQRIEKTADAFRSIGEAAKELGLQTHVLRYWESKFPQYIKPIKRRDGRRLFRAQDMSALRAIQMLVHKRGMTLKGAKALLREQGVETVLRGDARVLAAAADTASPASSPARALQASVRAAYDSDTISSAQSGSKSRLETVLVEIEDLKRRLDAVRTHKAA